MKPEWSAAPDWANFLAMDENGTWCWFENQPYARMQTWMDDQGRWRPCDKNAHDDWKYSLQARPRGES